MAQEKIYSRYRDVMVPNQAKMVYTQMTRNTQEPMTTITVGTTLLPMPREAAMLASIRGDTT